MDVSSVQKTRLTFTLISTPLLLVQHDVVPNTFFQSWVVDALKNWHWLNTPLLLLPIIGITILHFLRARGDNERYKLSTTTRKINLDNDKLYDNMGVELVHHASIYFFYANNKSMLNLTDICANFCEKIYEDISNIHEKITSTQAVSQDLLDIKLINDMATLRNYITYSTKNGKNKQISKEIYQSALETYQLSIKIKDEINVARGERRKIGLAEVTANILSEIIYIVVVWLVLLWPLVLHPALDALARITILLWPF